MSEQFAQVEAMLNTLIQRYQNLEVDYQKLREREEAWLTERAQLLKNSDIARTRIESMIARLKKLEADTQ